MSASQFSLEERREQVGVPLRLIAEPLGVPRSTVMRWLRSELVPGWAVRVVAEQLRLPLYRVLERCELGRRAWLTLRVELSRDDREPTPGSLHQPLGRSAPD